MLFFNFSTLCLQFFDTFKKPGIVKFSIILQKFIYFYKTFKPPILQKMDTFHQKLISKNEIKNQKF